MSWVIGIDPGLTGAIALLDDDQAVKLWDMPVIKDGNSNTVSGALLADILREALEMTEDRPTVVLEQVSAMPPQSKGATRRSGTVSMFRFGRSVGVIEGVLGALHVPLTRITPAQWKRLAKLTKKPKDEARSVAITLFPEQASELQRKKDVGRAEALLIGYFGALLIGYLGKPGVF